MKQKSKLLILKICGVLFKAILTVLEALEKTEEPEVLDKSVLDQEIPPTTAK